MWLEFQLISNSAVPSCAVSSYVGLSFGNQRARIRRLPHHRDQRIETQTSYSSELVQKKRLQRCAVVSKAVVGLTGVPLILEACLWCCVDADTTAMSYHV